MILCLDYGERYIGVAATDQDEKFAVRHSVIDQTKENALDKIAEIAMREEARLVLLGVPVSLSGNETAQTHATLAFKDKLEIKLGPEVEVVDVDETLTSVEAERHIKSEGAKPEEAHAEAARIMLADYLRASE